MDFLTETYKLLESHGERFSGQHQDIINMATAYGCDINEHVPTLIKYGSECNSITEMGVRFGWSSRSFLFTEPKKMLSIDKFTWDSINQSGMYPGPTNCWFERYKKFYSGLIEYEFLLADTTKIDPIDEVELLFIDTFHHRDCLEKELDKHGNQATKYIILHDTETFGEQGQQDNSLLFVDWITTNEIGTGLWYAINPWLIKNPHWKLLQHFKNNNGLTILRRD